MMSAAVELGHFILNQAKLSILYHWVSVSKYDIYIAGQSKQPGKRWTISTGMCWLNYQGLLFESVSDWTALYKIIYAIFKLYDCSKYFVAFSNHFNKCNDVKQPTNKLIQCTWVLSCS